MHADFSAKVMKNSLNLPEENILSVAAVFYKAKLALQLQIYNL